LRIFGRLADLICEVESIEQQRNRTPQLFSLTLFRQFGNQALQVSQHHRRPGERRGRDRTGFFRFSITGASSGGGSASCGRTVVFRASLPAINSRAASADGNAPIRSCARATQASMRNSAPT